MFFSLDKFDRRIGELGVRRYIFIEKIAPFVSMEGTLDKDEVYNEIPKEISGKKFDINDFFTGRDKYLWLEKTITVPPAKDGCEVIGRFDFGNTGDGNNSGFESLLYVDNKPYQGVDTNHKEVFFDGKEGTSVNLTFLLWTGLEGGGAHYNFYHQCKMAEFSYLHKKTDELYYFTKVIKETLLLLDEESEKYHEIKKALDRALLVINWDEDSFYETVDKAHERLMKELSLIAKKSSITVHTVGHTHIDVAWLWRLKHTREKVQRSFSTVLRLMERYDEYIFLQSQPQLYQYIKNDNPQLYEKIKKQIATGKWEADGGMWVEADCNLSSGESLVRQLLYGTRFFEREFGKKCKYLWLPDVFGYSWALPQILKLCEIESFVTSKISWNQYNSIPNDLFWWKGIDGTKILTYFIETPSEGASMKERFSTYNGTMTPHSVIGSWKKFKNKELSKDTLISYGYGDGGGGVNRDMLEMRRAMDLIPGLPNVKTNTVGNYLRKLHENVETTDRYVHTWDGELYLEYHRGTYTTQGYNKKMNRLMEFRLMRLEWLSSLTYILFEEYEKKQLYDSWEVVLTHQFHDIIPGSSIREVYEDSHINYEKAAKLADEVEKRANKYLIEEMDNVYSIYSTNSFAIKENVLIPQMKEGKFVDNNKILLAQKTDKGYYVEVELEPYSVLEIKFIPEAQKENKIPFVFKGNGIDTPFYNLEWNEKGQIEKLFDIEAKRFVLAENGLGNVLELFEDKPINNDAWDIDIFYIQKMEEAVICRSPELIEIGELKATIRFTYQYHLSKIVQDMSVYSNSRRIDFKTHIDWHEDHRLLKVAFYTDIRSTKATYDIQFGHVERPTHWNNSWDFAKFEVCGHKWADLSETGYGVSLLNDCKYGYSIKDNAIKLSLLKSSKYPDTEADMGEHDLIYSLYPHLGNVTEGGTIENANQINLPAQVLAGKFKEKRKIISLSNERVQIDAIKKAEDENCVVVRMHECRGGKSEVTITSEFPIKKIIPCNLLEHNCGETIDGSCVTTIFKPFEIKTYKLYF